MKRLLLISGIVAFSSAVILAQANLLMGAWERVSALDANGRPNTTTSGLLIISADGNYIYTDTPPNRPKVNKPLEQMSREELLARFQGLSVRRGTWTLSGNRWSRLELGSENPNLEGSEAVRLWRMEGDQLVLYSTDPENKTENRWRRVTSVR